MPPSYLGEASFFLRFPPFPSFRTWSFFDHFPGRDAAVFFQHPPYLILATAQQDSRTWQCPRLAPPLGRVHARSPLCKQARTHAGMTA